MSDLVVMPPVTLGSGLVVQPSVVLALGPVGPTGPVGPASPAATTTTTGTVTLAGDLGGTAAAPTVPGLAGKATAAQGAKADSAVQPGRTLPMWTYAHIGDSITYRNAVQPGSNESSYRMATGWMHHVDAALGQRMREVGNFAVAGVITTTMATTQLPQVLALNPRPTFCTVVGGTNDVVGSRTLSAIIADLTTIYDGLTAAGILIVAGTIPPLATLAPDRVAVQYGVNRWIKAQVNQRPGMVVADWFSRMADTAGVPLAGMLADGIHQTPKGAAVMGRTLTDILTPLVPAVDIFPQPGDPLNLIPNPFHTGTGGFKGTGVTGTVADSRTIAPLAGTPSAVASKVARDDGLPGEWQRIVVASGDVRMSQSVATAITVGSTYQAIAELRIDPGVAAVATRISIFLSVVAGDYSYSADMYSGSTDGTVTPLGYLPARMVLRTPPLLIAAGATGVNLFVQIVGGTNNLPIDIGRVACYPIT